LPYLHDAPPLWASEAAATDDDAVAPGLRHHLLGVGGVEDVAVAEHGHIGDVLLQPCDLAPVGRSRISLRSGPGVEGHGRGTLGGCDATGIEVGVVFVVD